MFGPSRAVDSSRDKGGGAVVMDDWVWAATAMAFSVGAAALALAAYGLWRTRARLWLLEQQLSRLEGLVQSTVEPAQRTLDSVNRRMAKIEGIIEFTAKP